MLPAAVHGAIRSSKRIKADTTMATRPDSGFPTRKARQSSAPPLVPRGGRDGEEGLESELESRRGRLAGSSRGKLACTAVELP